MWRDCEGFDLTEVWQRNPYRPAKQVYFGLANLDSPRKIGPAPSLSDLQTISKLRHARQDYKSSSGSST